MTVHQFLPRRGRGTAARSAVVEGYSPPAQFIVRGDYPSTVSVQGTNK
jgi:hypothetical protein